jgi:hypothetical protein
MLLNRTDPRRSDFAGPCPRCGGGVPSSEKLGQYPGALSRVDNETYICSQCGTDEAMYQWGTGRELPPLNQPARIEE